MSKFLDDNYELPKPKGGYMKLEQGENKFRVLSPAITGYEYWTKDNKPVRSKDYPNETPDGREVAGKVPVKHFWAMIVWNYNLQSIQILQLTQKSIQEAMLDYLHDEDYGEPTGYDLVISRTGEKLDTSYLVKAKPPTPTKKEILDEYKETKIDLTKLYEGENPFGEEGSEVSDEDNVLSSNPF